MTADYPHNQKPLDAITPISADTERSVESATCHYRADEASDL